MNVVLVHIGDGFPGHLPYCLTQLQLFVKCPIHLIVNRIHINKFNIPNVFALEDLVSSDEHNVFKKTFSLQKGFWQYATERFFYLHEYAKLKNLKNILHIENDNLVFYDFTKLKAAFETRPIWAVFDCESRAVPGLIYFRDSESLYPLVKHFVGSGSRGKNDMDAIGEFRRMFPDLIDSLPIITNYVDPLPPMFHQHAKLFGTLFDAAAVGQYIGGLDLVCGRGHCFGFINEESVFKCNKSTVEWVFEDGYKVLKLNGLRLVNLHVHSKDLRRWTSDPTSNIVSGERVQQLCDVFLGRTGDFSWNPVIAPHTQKHKDIDSIMEEWDNPKVLFCYGHHIELFQTKIHLMKNRYVLVTHNSDENITEKYLPILNHDKLIAMWSQNVSIEHPKLNLVPIGIANSMWPHGNLDMLSQVMKHLSVIPKTKDVYFNFNIGTNFSKRNECYDILKTKLHFEPMKSHLEYLHSLAQHKFAICPDGNGIDSHRIWECYYLGVIPILLDSVFARKLEKVIPCIILKSWHEFDIDECKKYVSTSDTSAAYLSYYADKFKIYAEQ
jgi:hypothetical protein